MELPFEKTVCRFWQQKLYAPVTREETQELKLPESMPDIGHVIAAWGQPILRGKDWRRDHISVSGGVMVWVLYAPEDGSGPRKVESWIPFQVRVDHGHSEDGVIRCECLITGVDARNLSARKMMLRANVGLMVQTLVPKQAELSAPGDLPPDIELLDRTYPMILTRETGERTFLCEEDIDLSQGMPQPQQMIYYRLSPRITEQKVFGSRAVFRGIGDLHILYQDAEERLQSADLEVPFAQYLDLDTEYPADAALSGQLCVTSLELDIREEGGVKLRCGMVCQYIIHAPSVIRCLEDAYSPCRELELVSQEVMLPAWLDEQIREVEFTEQLAREDVPVDRIFFPDLPMVTKQSGGVEVSIGGSFQTITASPDGSLSGKSTRVSSRLEQRCDCDTIPCTWLRGGVGSRRDGAGWTLDARMEAKLSSVCTKPISMISGIRAGECHEPDPERPGVIVRARREHETLWDIAKYCGSTVSAIQRMNKLSGEPEENRLLLIPVI